MKFNPNLFGQIGELMGYENPAKGAMGPLNQIPGAIGKYYDPYINAGLGALPGLQDQYGKLTGNPGGFLNDIGKGYQKSPGFDFALQQALTSGRQAAAAGGMAGSPAHEQYSMETATGLANQDYNNWLQSALGLYGTGLQGQQGLYGMGFNASDQLAQQIAQALAAKSSLKYAGQANENQTKQGMLGGFLGAGKSLLGGLF